MASHAIRHCAPHSLGWESYTVGERVYVRGLALGLQIAASCRTHSTRFLSETALLDLPVCRYSDLSSDRPVRLAKLIFVALRLSGTGGRSGGTQLDKVFDTFSL